jgi:hypothetical protein
MSAQPLLDDCIGLLAAVDMQAERKYVSTKLNYSSEALHYGLTGSVGTAAFLQMNATSHEVKRRGN